ncbi:MAG: WD40 repeat domain-containing protein [Candidatus Dadabacteria bacterium]|nr:MAG: WD40 repeat domain-containing protein [Candidatus Dadabacteria bacterium]
MTIHKASTPESPGQSQTGLSIKDKLTSTELTADPWVLQSHRCLRALLIIRLITALVVLSLSGCSIADTTVFPKALDSKSDSVAQQAKASQSSSVITLEDSSNNANSGLIQSGNDNIPPSSRAVTEVNKAKQKSVPYPLEMIGLFPYPGDSGLLSLSRNGKLWKWDLSTGARREVFELKNYVEVGAYNRKAGILALSTGSDVYLLNINRHALINKLSAVPARITTMAFQEREQTLLIGAADGRIYRWHYNTGRSRLERYIGHSSIVSAVVAHPYGKLFFSGDWDGGLNAWVAYEYREQPDLLSELIPGSQLQTELTTRVRARRRGDAGIEKLLITPNGEVLFVILQDGGIELWEVRGFSRRLYEKQVHRGMIYDAALSSDGSVLVTAGRDGFIRVWSYRKVKKGISQPAKYVLKKLNEIRLENVSALILSGKHTLIAGTKNGRLLSVDLPRSRETERLED